MEGLLVTAIGVGIALAGWFIYDRWEERKERKKR
jgi:hypothetical protein